MPTVRTDGADVYYETHGDSPRHVVFSHGFLMDHEMFQPQVEAMAAEFTCVTWDERGHGATRATRPFTYWDSARDVIAILDDLGAPDAALVGMSQGGFLSLRVALLAPERVRGLAFIDSQAGPEDDAARPVYEAIFEEWVSRGMSDAIARGVAAAIVMPADPAPWIARWRQLDPVDVGHSFRALMQREDLHDRLREIECRALVVHGTADPSISIDKARALCAGLRGCDAVVEIPGGGHAANLSHPAEANAVLAPFLRGLWE